MQTINVQTTDHEYDILIQDHLLESVGPQVSEVWQPRKVALISDDNVAPLYGELVQASLASSGFDVFSFTIPHGEQSKSLTELADLIGQMAQRHFDRHDAVIALGGGVVGDLAGFVAATYMRGIDLIQIPTSFLAQVDSSVGGKTAVDLDHIKNIVGSFHQPDLVLIDPLGLKTLKQRDLVEGYGEVVKVAALAGGSFWQLIQNINAPSDILKNAEELISMAITYKSDIVAQDEKESGQRQLLNLGHTIGHGVEALGDGQFRHGEAVSIGLMAISKIFEDHQLSPQGTTDELKQHLSSVGLPTYSPLLDDPHLIDKIKNDKKNHDGYINVVYLSAFGKPVIKTLSVDELAQTIKQTEWIK